MIDRGVSTEESPPRGYQASGGLVPVPDPTILTTAQLFREIAAIRELLESKVVAVETRLDGRITTISNSLTENKITTDNNIDMSIRGIKEVFETRIGGMDKAITLVSVVVDEKLIQLKSLHQEKFDSISVQFAERDTRTEQTAAGVKIAVDAALQAAKEAVAEQNRSFALATGKSETATMKQIDALGLAIQTANKGLDDKIADMKDRLTRIEGMDLGSSRSREQQFSTRAGTHGDNQNMIAIAAIIIGILIAAAGWLTRAAPVVIDSHRPIANYMHAQI